MVIEAYPQAVADAFPGCNVETTAPRRIWVDVPAERIVESVQIVREKLGLLHLSTIVAEDMRDHLLINYIFSGGPVAVTLRVKIDREKAEVPTISNYLVGALVYEREIHDLFGIVSVGHPDLCRQILPEDFPAGVYPMRKDVKMPRFGEEASETAK